MKKPKRPRLTMATYQEPGLYTIVTPVCWRWLILPTLLIAIWGAVTAMPPDRSEFLATLAPIFIAVECARIIRRLGLCAAVTTAIDSAAGTIVVQRHGLLRPPRTWELGLGNVPLPEIVEHRARWARSAFQVMSHGVVPLTGCTSIENANRCLALVRHQTERYVRS